MSVSTLNNKWQKVECKAGCNKQSSSYILNDDILKYMFGYIPCNFRYIASVTHQFKEVYSSLHPEKVTSYKNAVASITKTETFLSDRNQYPSTIDYLDLKRMMITASQNGNLDVLKWLWELSPVAAYGGQLELLPLRERGFQMLVAASERKLQERNHG